MEIIITEEEKNFLKQTYGIEIDDENYFLKENKLKKKINDFYINNFGINVDNKLNDMTNIFILSKVNFITNLYKKYEKIKQNLSYRKILSLSHKLTGSTGQLRKEDFEIYYNYFKNSNNNYSNTIRVCSILYSCNLLNINVNKFKNGTEFDTKRLDSYIRQEYQQGKYKILDDAYKDVKEIQKLEDISAENIERFKNIINKIAKKFGYEELISKLEKKEEDEVFNIEKTKEIYEALLTFFEPEKALIKSNYFKNHVSGECADKVVKDNEQKKYTISIFCDEKKENDMTAIHEINHGIELELLYENEDVSVKICGWQIAINSKNKEKTPFIEQLQTLTEEEKNTVLNYLKKIELSPTDEEAFINSGITVKSILFGINKLPDILKSEYIFLYENLLEFRNLNEAINELITKDIYGENYYCNCSYNCMLPIIEEFYKNFKEEIIYSRQNGNINIIFNKVGKENLLNLAQLASEIYNFAPNERDNPSIKEKFEQRKKEILNSMINYSARNIHNK